MNYSQENFLLDIIKLLRPKFVIISDQNITLFKIHLITKYGAEFFRRKRKEIIGLVLFEIRLLSQRKQFLDTKKPANLQISLLN